MRYNKKMKLQSLFNSVNKGTFNIEKCAFLMSKYCEKDWIQFADVCRNRYNRRRVAWSPKLEMYIMTWGSSQGSNIHTHMKPDECVVKVLANNLLETTYERNAMEKSNKILRCGEVYYGDKIHSIRNVSDVASVSLHIYYNGRIK